MIAIAYWSLWIRVPAYIVGVVIAFYSVIYWVEYESRGDSKKKWIFGILAFVTAFILLPAYIMAWQEKRVIAAFAELVVTHFFYTGLPIAGIFGGAFIGTRVYKATTLKWLGWVVGIIIGLLVGVGGHFIARQIPGVDWRMEKLSEEREFDDSYWG